MCYKCDIICHAKQSIRSTTTKTTTNNSTFNICQHLSLFPPLNTFLQLYFDFNFNFNFNFPKLFRLTIRWIILNVRNKIIMLLKSRRRFTKRWFLFQYRNYSFCCNLLIRVPIYFCYDIKFIPKLFVVIAIVFLYVFLFHVYRNIRFGIAPTYSFLYSSNNCFTKKSFYYCVKRHHQIYSSSFNNKKQFVIISFVLCIMDHEHYWHSQTQFERISNPLPLPSPADQFIVSHGIQMRDFEQILSILSVGKCGTLTTAASSM